MEKKFLDQNGNVDDVNKVLQRILYASLDALECKEISKTTEQFLKNASIVFDMMIKYVELNS